LITVVEEVPLRVPPEKLSVCGRVESPEENSQWLDIPGQFIQAIQILDKCNAGISAFWKWHDAQFVQVPE